ncbi:MAG: extracellular solute-binding protein [Butyrivibrio sp.]|nr:extracellular solute-binding protein [Butyrivibrio sp.]
MKARIVTAAFLITSVIMTNFIPASAAAEADKPVVLRVCNWEEYIDQGDWDDDEVIDLESGDVFGQNPMVKDFEDWYYETYGKRVKVEYSTFGTNEDLYNMLTIGDVYDLVCPSEYMIMKLMADDMVQPLSDEFFDPTIDTNYYIKGVSPYIRNIFETHDINGVTWDRCAAGYMWGITGFVYNPDVVSKEEASTWKLLENADYKRQVTIKDNVRDAYFAAVGALKSDLLTSDEFKNRPDYAMALQDEMNDVSLETVNNVQEYLQQVKDNLYSFETDSGKADMITGKVVANYQWSGDAVYTMDQAEEDDYYLNFAAPRESTNIYFDGWVMLKKGISQDPAKQQAAEAFINFVSRPDNAIRDMYYIGYTSVISGGDDGRVFEYLEWTYGAEDDTEDVTEYPVGYFFSGDPDDEDYILTVPTEQLDRQLGAQYPSSDVIDRASIMIYFDQAQSEVINRMWIRVRCFNILNVPVWVWIAGLLAICAAVFLILRHKAAKEKLYN